MGKEHVIEDSYMTDELDNEGNEPYVNEPTVNEPTANEPTANELTFNEPTVNQSTSGLDKLCDWDAETLAALLGDDDVLDI